MEKTRSPKKARSRLTSKQNSGTCQPAGGSWALQALLALFLLMCILLSLDRLTVIRCLKRLDSQALWKDDDKCYSWEGERWILSLRKPSQNTDGVTFAIQQLLEDSK